MSGIEYLQEWSKFFVISSRLESVARGLQKIIDGQKIDESESRNFAWVGDLIGQMDDKSKYYNPEEHPELSVIATQLAPKFYGALIRFDLPYNKDFSKRLSKTLKSYGKEVKLGKKELIKAQQVYQEMAESILIDLQEGSGQI